MKKGPHIKCNMAGRTRDWPPKIAVLTRRPVSSLKSHRGMVFKAVAKLVFFL